MKLILGLNKVDFQKGPTFQCITKYSDEDKKISKCLPNDIFMKLQSSVYFLI